MFRYKAPKRKDKKYFSNTAVKIKTINVADRVYRGGIRL